jgi:hypothetical protein
MTQNKFERTLLAILALEPEDGVSSEKDVHAFAAGSLPTLDTRVEMYLRAMHDCDAGAQNHTDARDRILAAMATDLENDAGRTGMGWGAAFLESPHSADRRLCRHVRCTSDLLLERSIVLCAAFIEHNHRRIARLGRQIWTAI